MKTILEWLHLAKEQGYDWADDAIRNYDPDFSKDATARSLEDAINNAFDWTESPQGGGYWLGVVDELEGDNLSTITPVTQASIEPLIEDLGKLNSALGNLAYNDNLKEPYRTQVYEATKASYEEQLAEVKADITKKLGIEPPDVKQLMEELSILKRDFDRQLSYIQELEVENDGLSRELEAHKATAEELNRSYVNEHNENYERMMKIEQLEKEFEAYKGKKLIGWVVANTIDMVYLIGKPEKVKAGWSLTKPLTPEEAIALCGRVPKWSDDEPIPVYEK